MFIFNNSITKEELFERISDISQIVDFKYYEFIDGMSKGVRAIDIGTPSGINLTILVDRAMDISRLAYNSIPICWKSPTREASAVYYEVPGTGFYNTYYGGFFTTCGLQNVGDPCIDEGEELGQHGRIGSLPAENISMDYQVEKDDIILKVKGIVREVRSLGYKFELSRTISTSILHPSIKIEDKIQNLAYKEFPLQILYHFNIGFPLLDRHTKLLIPEAETTTPAEKYRKENTIKNYKTFDSPQIDYGHEVLLHKIKPDSEGYCNVAIVNPGLGKDNGIGLWIKFKKDTLPYMAEWKHLEKGEYVTGLEPTNTFVRGRNIERKEGYLSFMGPGETREFKLETTILKSDLQIKEFEKKYL